MEQLSLYVLIIPLIALLFMITLIFQLRKKAVNLQTFMQLLINITVWSFILHFAWEMLQMPLFFNMSLSWQSTLFCTLASVVDTIMVLLIYCGFATLLNDSWWMIKPSPYLLVILVLVGGAGAVLAELLHIKLGTWSYSSEMPIMPALKVGLVPVLQFMLLPGVIYFIALSFKDLNHSKH